MLYLNNLQAADDPFTSELPEMFGLAANHADPIHRGKALSAGHGDSVIIGASSLKHIEQNLIDLEKGPLRASLLSPLTRSSCTDKGPCAYSGRGRQGSGRGMEGCRAVCSEVLALT